MKSFRFNLVVIVSALAFLLLTGRSEAAIGYWVNGSCYPASADAVSAFVSTFPKIENSTLLSISSAAFTNFPGIDVRFDNTNLISGFNKLTFVRFPLQTCDTLVQLNPIIDAPSMLYAFAWGFGAIMLFFGFGLAINSGITVIKKL